MSDIDPNLYFNGPTGSEKNVLLAKKKALFYANIDNQVFVGANEVAQAYEVIKSLKMINKGGFVHAALNIEQAFLASNYIPNYQEFLTRAKQEVLNEIKNKAQRKQQAKQQYALSPEGMFAAQEIEENNLKIALKTKDILQEIGLKESHIEFMYENFNPFTGETSGCITAIRIKFDSLDEVREFNAHYFSKIGNDLKIQLNRADQYCYDLSIKFCQKNLTVFFEVRQNTPDVKSGMPILREFNQVKKSLQSSFKQAREAVKNVTDSTKPRYERK